VKQLQTVQRFTKFVLSKPYVRLSDECCATKAVYFSAESLGTLKGLAETGAYLSTHGDLEALYELCFTRRDGVTRLREYQRDLHDLEDGEMKILVRYQAPFWTYLMQYEA
jgi:hypothetical protein